MVWRRNIAVAVVGMVALGGCAEWSSIQHEFAAAPDKVATIDAKQRVVAIQKIALSSGGSRVSVCVEQSPDVFSFLSGSLSLSAETKGVAAALAAAIAESGGSLAFRTQVTQAQSNLLYGICQMHAAGALSDRAVRTELRRFQQTLLGILAIEQLTAPTRGQPVQQILTTSSASVGKDVEIAQSKVDDAKKEKDDARTALDNATKDATNEKPADGQPESDAYKAAVKVKEKKQKDLDKAAVTLSLAEKSLSAAKLALSASASGPQQSIINVYPPPSAGVSDKVAEQVVATLELVLQRGVMVDNCAEFMFEGAPESAQTKAVALCEQTINAYLTAYRNRQDAYVSSLTSEMELRAKILDGATKAHAAKRMTDADYAKLLVQLAGSTASNAVTSPQPIAAPLLSLNRALNLQPILPN
jgi:hypothetical protein